MFGLLAQAATQTPVLPSTGGPGAVPALPPASLIGISPVQSLGIPLLIGVLACLLALPAAWWLGRAPAHIRRTRLPLLAVVMIMPPHLAFSGWSLLRAPGTTLGDWIAHWPAWANLGVSQLLAVLGLAIWSTPLATVLLIPSVRSIEPARLEALAMDGVGPIRQLLLITRWLRPGLLLASLAVAVLALGSAVPLHLAQFQTLAIDLWARLMLAPAWTSMFTSWPLLLVALTAGAVTLRFLLPLARGTTPPDGRDTPQLPAAAGTLAPHARTARGSTAVIWIAGTIVPLVLFARILPDWHVAIAVVQRTGPAIGNSLLTAGAVFAVTLILGLGITGGIFTVRRARLPLAVFTAALVAIAVLPGVLIGMILRLAADFLGRSLGTQPSDEALLVLAHLARFGCIVPLAGWWLFASQSSSLRDLFAAEPGSAPRRYLTIHARQHLLPLAFGALGTAMLSLHEIEAAVMLQPPGRGTLSQRVLDLLHYNRDTDLAALNVTLIGAGLLLALTAATLVARTLRHNSNT